MSEGGWEASRLPRGARGQGATDVLPHDARQGSRPLRRSSLASSGVCARHVAEAEVHGCVLAKDRSGWRTSLDGTGKSNPSRWIPRIHPWSEFWTFMRLWYTECRVLSLGNTEKFPRRGNECDREDIEWYFHPAWGVFSYQHMARFIVAGHFAVTRANRRLRIK